MSNPFFSVIIPSYNRAHLISKTIDFVLRQTYRDFELIIIDDASTDNTEAVVREFNDSRVIYYKNEKNLERSASRNKGIKLAKGTFVCFCDSDDHWHQNHLSLLKEAIVLNNYKEAFYFTGMIWCLPDRKQEVIFPAPKGNLIEYAISYQVGTPTTCFSKNILQKYKFRTDMSINEDVELFSRIVSEYNLVQVPFCTVNVIIHNENTKALTKDYISPQIHAMEIIFNNPSLKHKISSSFKRKVRRNLLHQLIQHLRDTNQASKIIYFCLKFLLMYPFDTTRKEKFVLFLYNLPGGSIFEKTIQKLKRSKND
jgi:glycosyltransferase involved in cell wall biosynthesis